MVKIKKFVSLFSVILIILSNIAFAQYSEPSQYEGRPIDPEKEGKEYYREGDVIVYPAKTDSKERDMMERFNRGEFSEEEMRKMAKEELGDDFDEMEFKKSMIESKERMERKDAFYYEHEGYQGHYYRPSYEGYSKEHMIFGMLFEHIRNDMDPRDIKQNCNEPDKIADIVISKLKEKIGDFQSVCKRIDEQESKCEEHSKKGCSQIGAAFVREDATELEKLNSIAYSCPPNKDAIVEACKKRGKLHMEQRLNNLDEECRKRFDYEGERLLQQCERFKQDQVCDKEKYMERCMGGIKKEESKPICPAYPTPQCESNSVLRSKTDSNGCVYYYCKAVETLCPQDVQQCLDGSFVSRDPANNCTFKPCPTAPPQCTQTDCGPQLGMPNYLCPDGKTTAGPTGRCLRKADGICGWEVISCPTTTTTSTTTQTCPTVTKPTCTEGQSMVTKYDDKGCITSYECVSVTSNSSSLITGAAFLSTYDDFLRHCENSWNEQQRICLNTPKACNKEDFIQKCKDQERKHGSDLNVEIERNCQTATESEIRHAEDRCSRIDDERKKCHEQSAKRCGQMKGLSEECRELMTEERIRNFIVEEVKKRCKFKDIVADEEDVRKADKVEIILAILNTATEVDIGKLKLFIDELKEDLELQDTTIYKGTINPNSFGDIKLLPFVVNAKVSAARSSVSAKEAKESIVASSKVEEAASKLASLRDSDVPAEYLYIIEDKASEVLDASDKLEDVENKEEQKGIGYRIKLFLGLARAAEQEEIKQLEESNSKLQNSIKTLTKLIEEVPSDVAKAILKEQVENLKEQQADIQILIETKEKKAKGLFGVFG